MKGWLALTSSLVLLTLLAACGDALSTNVPATVAPVATATIAPTTPATGPAATAASTTTPVTAIVGTATPNVNIPLTATPKASPKATGKPVLGTPFELKINQAALIESENVEIKFLRVLEDSRCPTNVNCAWSGQIVADVSVSKNGKPVGTFALNNIEATRNKDKKVFEDYALTLLKAEPTRFYANYGGSDAKINDIKPEDYVLSFLLTKVVSSGEVIKATASTPFDLKINQSATITPDNFEVKFLRVVKDERCPASPEQNVYTACNVAGPAVIEVAVSKNGQAVGNFQLANSEAYNGKSKKLFDNYSLTMVDIKPNRIQYNLGSGNFKTEEVNPADYVVSLLAIKLP